MHKCKTGNLSLGIGVLFMVFLCVPIIGFCLFNLLDPTIALREKEMDAAGLAVFGGTLFYCLRHALIAKEIEIEFDEYIVIFHFSAAQEQEMTWDSLKEQILCGDVRLEPPAFCSYFKSRTKKPPPYPFPSISFIMDTKSSGK